VIGVPTPSDRSKKEALASGDELSSHNHSPLAGESSTSFASRLAAWTRAASELTTEESLLKEALGIIADHVPCDLVEINLFDESVGHFMPLRWASAHGKSFIRKQAPDRYQLGEGYTGWIAEHRAPLIIEDTASRTDLIPKTGLKSFPFKSYLGIPLLSEQLLLGTLEIAHRDANTYTQSHLDATLLFSSQLTLALRFHRLLGTVDQHARQQAISNAMCHAAGQIHDLDRLWEGLSLAFLDHLELSVFGIFLQQEDTGDLTTPYLFHKAGQQWAHVDASLPVRAGSDLAAIWLHQEYWFSNQVSKTTISKMGLDAIKPWSLDKILLTPILASGNRLGLLLVGRSRQQPTFDEGQSKALLSLGRQAGIMLQSSRQLGQFTSRASPETSRTSAVDFEEAQAAISPERMAELLRLSAELTTSLDIDRSLRRVLLLCNELMLADRAVFITRDLIGDEFQVRQVMPEYDNPVRQQADALISAAQSISAWVAERRQSLLIDDLVEDGRWRLEAYASLCAVPCLTGNQITGFLLFFAKHKAAFGPNEQQIAVIVGRQMASALNNSYLYGVIREQADRLGLMLRSQQIETSQSNAILESIADGVIVTNAEHNVILYNTAAERILNLPTSQVIGKKLFDFIGIFGAETVQWGETIRQWRTTPPEDHQQPSKPERMILEDGRIISILPAPVVLGGDFLGTVSIFRDITREVEVDRLKSEFVATVSHELRTPMTSIKGFVDLMLMGAAGNVSDQQRHFLEIVRTNTNRLEILVNDLLDISRIEAGKAALVFQELDVHQLLVEMEQYLQHRCQEESKSMQFTHEAPKELPPIWGDLERVRQILANLIENSFDYTPDGGSIHMRAREADDQIEIEVSDNGMGISLEEQERIFERFYRGEQALIMGVSGTGLGLAIVLNLVEMHQGRIWVTSEGVPGKGTTFTVSLPTASRNSQQVDPS
jgi:PAS domain S-box-containing protein